MEGLQHRFAAILGAALVLIGIIGFINDPVFGIFDVNGAHNAVHLLSGAAGIVLGVWGSVSGARWFNRIFGIVYGLVTVLGFAGLLGFLDVNAADNVLHLILAAVSVGVGFWGKD